MARPPRDTPSTNPQHPRLHVRYGYSAPIHLEILLQDRSQYTPWPVEGELADVSINGMKLVIDDLQTELYNRLLKKVQVVRAHLPVPERSEPLTLMGKIVWLDYYRTKGERISGPCHFGIFIDERAGDDYPLYADFIAGLERNRTR